MKLSLETLECLDSTAFANERLILLLVIANVQIK